MIYCVVPEALEAELFDKLTQYYADDPNVTVIVDRRKGSRPGTPAEAVPPGQRDRRRARVPGELPKLASD